MLRLHQRRALPVGVEPQGAGEVVAAAVRQIARRAQPVAVREPIGRPRPLGQPRRVGRVPLAVVQDAVRPPRVVVLARPGVPPDDA